LPAGVQVTTLEPTVKNGQITVHLRVIGPRDRDVELVQNLEHSRHFLMPRIVGENAESMGGPNQRPEPVSASNRVDFDVLADYTAGSAQDRKLAQQATTQKTQGDAAGGTAQKSTSHRPPYTGMARPHPPVQKYQGGPPR
jgi:type IV pilus assembly protein PilN